MNLFTAILGGVLLLAFVMYSTNRIKNRDIVFLIITFLILYIIHSFKDPFSLNDTPLYYRGYHEAINTSWDTIAERGFRLRMVKAEQGYVIFNKVFASFLPYPQVIFILTSFVILIGYFVTIYRYSAIIWLSVIMFYIGSYEISLFVIRQFMAMSILLFSYPFILERRIKPFLLLLFLAFSMHQTAIVFAPVYFLYGIKDEKKIIVISMVAAVLLSLYMRFVLVASLSYLKGYGTYVNTDASGTNAKMAMLMCALLFFRIWLLQKNLFEEGIDKLLSIILVLGAIISFGGIGFVPTSRLNMYYTGMMCIIFPNTLMYERYIVLRWAYGTMFVGFLSYFYLRDIGEFAIRFRMVWE